MHLDTIAPYDWDALQPHFDSLAAEPLTPADVPGWLERWSELDRLAGEWRAVAARAKDEDSNDEAARERFVHFTRQIQPRWDTAVQALRAKLLSVEGYTPGPADRELIRLMRCEVDLFREENVPLRAEESARGMEYQTRVGRMTVPFRGETLSWRQADRLLREPDRATREEAWRAVAARWLQEREALGDLIVGLLPLRRRIAANAGLPDFLEYRWRELRRLDYTPAQVRSLHATIQAVWVPLATRVQARRQARLGLDAMRPWDTVVDPESRPVLRPFADVGALEAGVERIFDAVDPEFGALWNRMRDGFMDLGARPGKSAHNYHCLMPRSRMPYVFGNFSGTHMDMVVTLHEGGHAFHAAAAGAAQPLVWNVRAPLEFCEVASHGMELLALPWMEAARGGVYGEEDARRACEEQMERALTLLCQVALSDSWQHWLYTEAPEDVDAAALEAKWRELQDRFLPPLDWSGLEATRDTMWHRIVHLFAYPLYTIEYALAQLGALQIWRAARADPEGAMRRFKKALALGGTRPLPELFRTAGASLAFDEETSRGLAETVAEELALG